MSPTKAGFKFKMKQSTYSVYTTDFLSIINTLIYTRWINHSVGEAQKFVSCM